jgi:large subunit ribosomal protein L25
MGLVNLEIKPRSSFGKNENRRTRAAGQIPAVLYGKDRETEHLELDAHTFSVALMHLAGRTALFSLNGDEDNIALLREVQRNPITDEILHVDLYSIPRGVPMTVPVALEVVGECPAVKAGDASVAMSLDRIEISVRPSAMPDFLEIDISDLEVNDKIFAKDVKFEDGELITDPEVLILNIKASALVIEEVEEDVEGEGEEGAEGSAEGTEGGEGGDEEKKED